jgi:hypothetical protein
MQRWNAPIPKHWPLAQQSAECLVKWRNAVSLNSSADLTYQSDKLIAIAGVAKHIFSLWPDSTTEYLAGLWSYDLIISLLWSIREPIDTSLRLENYRAPSWSWAALNGEICPEPDRSYVEQQIAFIQEAITSPINDPFGAVGGGYIHIKGPLCAAGLHRPINTFSAPPVSLESTNEEIATLKLMFDYSDPGLYESSRTHTIYLLGMESNNPDFAASFIRGLILEPSGDRRGQYVRLGCFSDRALKNVVDRSANSASANLTEMCQLSLAFKKSRLAESFFLDSHDDGMFTIEII